MDTNKANKIAKSISKMLGCDCEVYDFDDETLYINTGEDMLDFKSLLNVRERYNIEAINIDDYNDGYLVLQLDLRTEQEK